MKVIVYSLVLACVMTAHALQRHFEATSVRSTWLEPLRVNKTFEIINECNEEIQKPYGILEHTFGKKITKEADLCMWILQAPENHIIHVVYISIDLEDKRSSIFEDEKVTTVNLYDGSTYGKNHMFGLPAESERRLHPFAQSLSTGRDLLIDVDYHVHKIFGTQKVTIKYEFVDLDKLKELLV